MELLRLYRGLKSSEFLDYSPQHSSQVKSSWKQILKKRLNGDFLYDTNDQKLLSYLEQMLRLQFQHFTDKKEVAQAYGAVVLCIEVPLADVLDFFVIEFQNYAKRKESFDLVYGVKGEDLHVHAKKWKLRIE